MSPGLKNGRIIQPEQADVGRFQSQYDPETTPNTVRHNVRALAGDIHTQTHEGLKQSGCRARLETCKHGRIDRRELEEAGGPGSVFLQELILYPLHEAPKSWRYAGCLFLTFAFRLHPRCSTVKPEHQ